MNTLLANPEILKRTPSVVPGGGHPLGGCACMLGACLGPVIADDSLGLLKKKIENKQTIYTSIELVQVRMEILCYSAGC